MPHPGQGSPVAILKGQSDWADSTLASCCQIKKGTTSVIIAPAIIKTFLIKEALFVELVDITLYNHCGNHRKEKS